MPEFSLESVMFTNYDFAGETEIDEDCGIKRNCYRAFITIIKACL